MIDNLFIVYANESFRDNPKNLFEVFKVIYSSLDTHLVIQKNQLKYLAEQLNAFAECNDHNLAKEHRKESLAPYLSKVRWLFSPLFDVAYEAAYRYRNGYCPEECIESKGDGLAKTALKFEYGGARRLKCFECQQLYFRDLLTKLVGGESLIHTEVVSEEFYKAWQKYHEKFGGKPTVKVGEKYTVKSDITDYIESARDCIGQKIRLSDDGNMEEITFIKTGYLLGEFPQYELKYRFEKFITSLVGFSLKEFLLNDERAKLKLCCKCDKFFIASKNDARIKFCPDCSQKSKKSKAEKAEYQRQYRLKKKKEIRAEKLEARIKNMIQRTGYSREEVIEIIEADSMM